MNERRIEPVFKAFQECNISHGMMVPTSHMENRASPGHDSGEEHRLMQCNATGITAGFSTREETGRCQNSHLINVHAYRCIQHTIDT